MATTPSTIKTPFKTYIKLILILFFLNKKAAKGGIKNKATIIDSVNANVFVKANGLNNFPSAPIIVNTGMKLIIVVITAVTIAPDTSAVAL